MKKAVKIILSVLLVLVLAVAAVCYWQRDNLAALKMSLSTSKEDLSQMISDNNQKISDATQKVAGIVVRDLTDEEKEALRNEEISREEMLERLTGEQTSSDSESEVKEDSTNSSAADQEEPASASETEASNQKKLSQYLAEIYLMKAEYTNWLEAKYAAAIAEYTELDESEHTTANKYKIGMSYMSEALKKEKECDAKMAELENEISALLTEMGEDTSLVDDIKTAYAEEKALKKAYYLGLHS